MNINSCLNSPSFGSIYKFQVDKTNYRQMESTEEELYKPETKDSENYSVLVTFPTDSMKTGIYEKVHINADDKYDKYIESLLKQKNIKFKKQSKKDALKLDNIFNRIVVSKKMGDKKLITLDTKKVENLFKKNQNFYISPNGEYGAIGKRYQNVIKYLETGRDIDATELVLREEAGELKLSVYDGRHRFAVMRDMGMKKIKFALDEDSCKLARKYGLTV